MRAPNLGAGAGQQNQIKKALGGKWNFVLINKKLHVNQ